MLRRLALAAVSSLLLILGVLAVIRARDVRPSRALSNPPKTSSQSLALMAAESHMPARTSKQLRPARPVYNYSVVPGGVTSGAELRDVTARDRSVAEHYSGFRYDRARVVRLKQPALVYLSYRLKDKIYWTRTRHKLRSGELLLTDGQITARTKCANQISAQKQLVVSPEEPSAEKLEEVAPEMAPPAEVRFPAEYHTALLSSPGSTPGSTPGSGFQPPAGGFPWFPAPLPPGGKGCETAAQEKHEKDLGIDDDESKETHCPEEPPPPTTVPEPGSMLLLGSGLAAIYAGYRRKVASRQRT
ncbi:MAG TPA: PEP-CTERM sorting domain-containing protein [Terriglobales bacterium]|jgi:hypothetical protein